jgi:hypothetical protein
LVLAVSSCDKLLFCKAFSASNQLSGGAERMIPVHDEG